ncbi:hypothetical protein SAMN05443144_106172 [Fodinibius roseus]|uniref:DUF4382 domain-containing protein n=1 Tax=Fodinibius roseus TaxID=1194090 RepID=A0A1M4ZY18_9BACT|nr:hypothetical protein [Fodinibius roseus]SHF22973.1 hypothetical protein SAMN05443144_106172 [Fodinibius roseus]
MKLTDLRSFTTLFALLAFLITGCDTTSTNTEPEKGEGTVELQFKTVSGSSTAKTASSGTIASTHDSLTIKGTNGTLQVDDIRFIVSEFELEPADTEGDSEEIEEFESQPFFVDLPLGEETLSLANSQVRAGLYEELKFKVEDLDFDEAEDEEKEEHQALADSIRSGFSDWPDEASMVLTGTFTSTDGQPQSFKVFAKAEIEIEREFNPPLEVTEDNIQQVVSVRINPAKWLENEDGSVLDLRQYDWNEHEELIEFEVEFEDGVEEIEVDDDDFEDDDEEDEDDDDDNEDDD